MLGLAVLPAGPAQAQPNGDHPAFRYDARRTGRSPHVGASNSFVVWRAGTGGYVASSPAIGEDGTAYVGSSNGRVYAVSPTGDIKWSYATGAPVSSSPAIGRDGTVYVGSQDNYLYALNPDGTLRWRFWTQQGALIPPSAVHSSPIVTQDGRLIFSSLAGTLYSVDATTGGLQWVTRMAVTSLSSPAIAPNGNAYIGCMNGFLYSFRPNGSLEWTYNAGSVIHSVPSIGEDGTIYVTATDGTLHAVNPNGSQRWAYASSGSSESSPSIGADGSIYFGSTDGYLRALWSDGALKWAYNAGQAIYSSPLLDANDSVYFGTFDGRLLSLNSDGSLRWSAQLGSQIRSSPSLSSWGTVFIGCDNDLVAVGDVSVPEPATFAQLACLCLAAGLGLRRRSRR